MERFSESWLWEPLDGPTAYEQVPYISIEDDYSRQTDKNGNPTRKIYQCFLCETGEMNSENNCKEHVHSYKHQKQYKLLKTQQKCFYQEMKLPDSFCQTLELQEQQGGEDSEPTPFDNTLSYVLPFRRWQYGRWSAGSSCQLCGTAALPTRMAVVQHFLFSKRHQTIRSKTFRHDDHHVEFHRLEPRIQALLGSCQLYQWHVERAMIAYVAQKEASHAGLASHPYAWYQLLWTLETYELRERSAELELAIWKKSLLQYNNNDHTFANLEELLVFFLRPQEETSRPPPIAEYWKVKRVTSGAMQIILCVLPFLRKYPKL